MTTATKRNTAQAHGTERYSKLPPAPVSIRYSDSARRAPRAEAHSAATEPATVSAIFADVFRSMFGDL